MSPKVKPKFITDVNGRKKEVVLSLKEYEQLMDFLEDIQDSYELLKAEKTAKKFIPYEKFRETLKKERRI